MSLTRTIRRNMERMGYTTKDRKLQKKVGKVARSKSMSRAEYADYLAEQDKKRREQDARDKLSH